jgi:hypothetical protein
MASFVSVEALALRPSDGMLFVAEPRAIRSISPVGDSQVSSIIRNVNANRTRRSLFHPLLDDLALTIFRLSVVSARTLALQHPSGLALRNDELIVSDCVSHRIFSLTPTGSLSSSLRAPTAC